jgi:hypothetical protein
VPDAAPDAAPVSDVDARRSAIASQFDETFQALNEGPTAEETGGGSSASPRSAAPQTQATGTAPTARRASSVAALASARRRRLAKHNSAIRVGAEPVRSSAQRKKGRKKTTFGGGQVRCQNCAKAVYAADKQMSVEGKVWHMGCFTCSYPGHDAVLSLQGFTIAAGKPYCKTHCA